MSNRMTVRYPFFIVLSAVMLLIDNIPGAVWFAVIAVWAYNKQWGMTTDRFE